MDGTPARPEGEVDPGQALSESRDMISHEEVARLYRSAKINAWRSIGGEEGITNHPERHREATPPSKETGAAPGKAWPQKLRESETQRLRESDSGHCQEFGRDKLTEERRETRGYWSSGGNGLMKSVAVVSTSFIPKGKLWHCSR